LGIPVVPVSARNKTGLEELEQVLSEHNELCLSFLDAASISWPAVNLVLKSFAAENIKEYPALYKAHQLFARDEKWREQLADAGFSPNTAQAEESLLRYGVIARHLEAGVGKATGNAGFTQKIDRWITHKVGLCYFSVDHARNISEYILSGRISDELD
jgi:Fe2+ transport system protein B